MEIKDLKVGDEVFISWGHDYKLVKVEKITPNGFIKIGKKLFYPDGDERCRGWHRDKILIVNEENIKKVRQIKHDIALTKIRSELRDYNYRKIPDELILEIHDLIKKWEESQEEFSDWNGH